MVRLRNGVMRAVVVLAFALAGGTPTMAQDQGALCGRDQNGNPLPCQQQQPPNPNATLESACMTTARVDYCRAYFQNNCQVRGFPLACKMYQMGSACYSGDQNGCNAFQQVLNANRACALDRDQNACAFLQQQGF